MDRTLAQILGDLYDKTVELDRLAAEAAHLREENANLAKLVEVLKPGAGEAGAAEAEP